MLVYPSGVDVSSSALRFLAARLREHRRAPGTRWRRLNAGRQALLTLAYLRNGQPYAQLAAGFGIGTTTDYRYITEAVNLLAALAPTLTEAVRAASTKAYVIHSPRPASPAGQTRATRVQAARSVSLTAADGTASPPASRPSTGPTQRSVHLSSRPSPPSSPGASSANSAARPPGSRASSKPSWSSGSLSRAEINPQHSPGPSIRPRSSPPADERRRCNPHRRTPGPSLSALGATPRFGGLA